MSCVLMRVVDAVKETIADVSSLETTSAIVTFIACAASELNPGIDYTGVYSSDAAQATLSLRPSSSSAHSSDSPVCLPPRNLVL